MIYADASIYRVGHQSRDGDYPVGCGLYSWLLFCYGGEEIWIACLDGLVSVGLLAAAGFLYGYVDGTIHALQIQVALAVLVQAISLAGAFELQVLLERGNVGDFMDHPVAMVSDEPDG